MLIENISGTYADSLVGFYSNAQCLAEFELDISTFLQNSMKILQHIEKQLDTCRHIPSTLLVKSCLVLDADLETSSLKQTVIT